MLNSTLEQVAKSIVADASVIYAMEQAGIMGQIFNSTDDRWTASAKQAGVMLGVEVAVDQIVSRVLPVGRPRSLSQELRSMPRAFVGNTIAAYILDMLNIDDMIVRPGQGPVMRAVSMATLMQAIKEVSLMAAEKLLKGLL